MLAAVITLSRDDAWTLGVVVQAALRNRELPIDWGAAVRVCAALRGVHGHGFSIVTVELTDAERDAARTCWQTLALGYPQIDHEQYLPDRPGASRSLIRGAGADEARGASAPSCSECCLPGSHIVSVHQFRAIGQGKRLARHRALQTNVGLVCRRLPVLRR